jgi:hypothetical protein
LAGYDVRLNGQTSTEARRDALKPYDYVQFEAASRLADETETRRISGIFVSDEQPPPRAPPLAL